MRKKYLKPVVPHSVPSFRHNKPSPNPKTLGKEGRKDT